MKITIDTKKLSNKFLVCRMKWDPSLGVCEEELSVDEISFSAPTEAGSFELENDECLCVVVPIKIPKTKIEDTHQEPTDKDLK